MITAKRALCAVLVLGALACLALSLHLMYQAGCTGDPKGGALGDVPRALEIEGAAVAFGWGGLLLAALVAAFIPRISALRRGLVAVVIVVLGFVFWTCLGMNAEVRGVQACLSGK